MQNLRLPSDQSYKEVSHDRQEIHANEFETGMTVLELDRPGYPSQFQGFLITTQLESSLPGHLCSCVLFDLSIGLQVVSGDSINVRQIIMESRVASGLH